MYVIVLKMKRILLYVLQETELRYIIAFDMNTFGVGAYSWYT